MIALSRSISVTLVFVSLLAACNQAATPKDDGSLTPESALNMMYHDKALSIPDTTAFLKAPVENYTTTIQINLILPIGKPTPAKYLVITAGAFDYCHICPATIDGAVFARVNGRWQIETMNAGITEIGSFGSVSGGAAVEIGPNATGALLQADYAAQGYHTRRTVIIAETRTGLRSVFDALTSEGEDNQDNQPVWGYTSELSFVVRPGAEYYDLQVIRSGTNRDSAKLAGVQIYSMSDMGYVAQQDK